VKPVILPATILCGMTILSSGTIALQAAPKGDEPILKYIERTWAVLARSNRTLATSAVDPKFQPEADGRWPVYISAAEDRARIEAQLRREIPPGDLRLIDLRTLPSGRAPTAGLLYLPQPYVVPGGRFNEMYGWDSDFIVRGLLRDGLVTQAKAMVDDFLYEIRNYGKILNANRAYYLTRSQPPLLTGMLLAVYGRTHSRQWIEDAVPAIETYYRYWTSEPHLTHSTGLSRYFDLGDGPAPEVIASEREPGGFNALASCNTSARIVWTITTSAGITTPKRIGSRRCSTRVTGRCANRVLTLRAVSVHSA
jgi:alpha,alpha-trehalase